MLVFFWRSKYYFSMPYRYLKRESDSKIFHVYNRGIDKMTLFKTPKDYNRFIDRMFLYTEESQVQIIAYCLMRNHFHLLLKENEFGNLAKYLHKLSVSYAMYFNLKYKHSGYVFQGPYKDKPVDSDEYLLEVSAYIHNNPLKLGVNVETFLWSSYKDYLSGLESNICKEYVLGYFSEADKVNTYYEFVKNHQDQVFNQEPRPGLEEVRV